MTDLRFTKDWCKEGELISLDYALDAVTQSAGEYIEIGSFEGKSTVFIANKIFPKRLHAVDTWKGGAIALAEQEAYASDPIEENFLHNITTGTKGNVIPHKMDWRDYFTNLHGPQAISFIYIDGPHDHRSVYDTLEIVAPLMAHGGIILGDDYLDDNVSAAVTDFYREDKFSPVFRGHFLIRA